MLVVDREAQRLDQMQWACRGHRKTADRAGVDNQLNCLLPSFYTFSGGRTSDFRLSIRENRQGQKPLARTQRPDLDLKDVFLI